MFAVLHSSAGAGKTHALVKHYLTLCLSDQEPGSYRQVLALTFTNKAAGEMQDRVMGYLEKLAARRTDDGAIADVMEHLQVKTKLTPEGIAERASAVLRHMLHHWSDVAIGTIDAFTRRVVRPFARDLQLDHDLRMTTDQEHYLNAAVEALVAEAGSDPKVTAILTEACLQLLHEEGKWDPEKPLKALSNELQKESALKPLQSLRELDADHILRLTARLREQENVFRKAVQAIGREALELVAAERLTEADIAHGKGGILGYFRKLASFTQEWEPAGPNARKPIETGKWHSTKADVQTRSTLERIAPQLTDLFHKAEELCGQGHAYFLLRRGVARELPAAFALHELDRHLEQLKQADAVAFFSDLTRKVAAVVQEEPVPFIYERMGERYRHFLIDEFQDTSLLQWTCLLPLIDNALGNGGSALLVGDAKQAIYRWRNGEVRLFVELPKVFGRGDSEAEHEREQTLQRTFVKQEPLAYNRRSSPVIIAFNNALFGELSEALAPSLRSVYKDHAQLTAGDRPGLVELQRLPKDVKGAARDESQQAFVLERLQQALADGHRPGDVAVLVRTGNQGYMMAEHLLREGYSVVSPDGLKLAGDHGVELLVDLLRFMHDGDPTAAARTAQRRAQLDAAPDQEAATPFTSGSRLPDPAAQLRTWLEEHGLTTIRSTFTELLGRLCAAVNIRPAEEAQVLAFLDEAHSWSTLHGPDIGGFVEHWESAGAKRAVAPPANGQAVQIMTVHKAKGLEFPVVIMPTGSMGTAGNHTERFWIDPRPAIPELEHALVVDGKALRESGIRELQIEHELQDLDLLNMLYVAFTRPVNRLHVLVSERSLDVVTRALLAYMDQHGRDGNILLGERTQMSARTARTTPPELRDVSTPEDAPRLTLRLEKPDDWDPADPDPFRSFGEAVHEVMARVGTLHELDPAMDRAVQSGRIDRDKAADLKHRLGALLSDDRLAPWYGPGLVVRNEATIIDRSGRSHRPDRVVEEGDRVRVLDIKTGHSRPEHHEQVRGYMELLRELGHSKVEGALLYVRDGTIETVNG
jgi:ATP-dependent exoDNAse (exonuclease V) beta subunit